MRRSRYLKLRVKIELKALSVGIKILYDNKFIHSESPQNVIRFPYILDIFISEIETSNFVKVFLNAD